MLHDTRTFDPAERRVGTVLSDKWKLDRLIGVGGMAAVYAATHRNGARAAIKLFSLSVTTSTSVAARFLREGYLANKIDHPAIVRVLDDHLDLDNEVAYLVMELLEGETVRQTVERAGPLPPLRAIELLIDLCDCLDAAHRAGVVHRDIKPENLFLTTDGHLKVLDFGVARGLEGAHSTLTRSGAALGTPAYMSPEQARGRASDIGPRSDIFSAGATFLYSLTGKLLHEGESAQEILVKAAWTPAVKTKQRCPELHDDIAAVIDRANAFEPDDRYPDIRAFRAQLQALRSAREAGRPESDTTIPVASSLLLDSPTAHPRRLSRFSLLATAALVPTVVAAGWALTRESSPTGAPLAASKATTSQPASDLKAPEAVVNAPRPPRDVPETRTPAVPVAVDLHAASSVPPLSVSPPRGARARPRRVVAAVRKRTALPAASARNLAPATAAPSALGSADTPKDAPNLGPTVPPVTTGRDVGY